MATNPIHKMDSEKSVYLDREEHFHRGNVGAKAVVPYSYDATTDTLLPIGGNFITATYDYVGVDNSGTTTKVFTFKSGGASGTTVNTVTLNYADSTKADLTSVVKT